MHSTGDGRLGHTLQVARKVTATSRLIKESAPGEISALTQAATPRPTKLKAFLTLKRVKGVDALGVAVAANPRVKEKVRREEIDLDLQAVGNDRNEETPLLERKIDHLVEPTSQGPAPKETNATTGTQRFAFIGSRESAQKINVPSFTVKNLSA